MAEEAEQFKAAGNKALQAGNLTEAIENYTKSINCDGTNHVYYSNRSAAYLKKGDGNNALEDAKSTIAINPEFSKGYSRKGGEFILYCFVYEVFMAMLISYANNTIYLYYSCTPCFETL